jgi:hypothetical protein
MPRKLKTFRIPVRETKGAMDRNKAVVAFEQRWKDGERVYVPTAGARVVEVTAATVREAYEQLCDRVRPGDGRPIMGRKFIPRFVVRTPPGDGAVKGGATSEPPA